MPVPAVVKSDPVMVVVYVKSSVIRLCSILVASTFDGAATPGASIVVVIVVEKIEVLVGQGRSPRW